MKFCTNCGAQLPDQTKFCSNCGQKLEIPVEPVAPAVPVDPDVVSQKPLYTPPAPPAPVVQEPVAPVQEPVAPPVFVPPVQPPVAPPAPPVQPPAAPAEPVFVPPVAPPVQPPVAPAEPAFVPPVAPPAPSVQQPTYAQPAPPAPPVQQPTYAPPAPPAPPVPPAPPMQGYAPPAPPMGYAPPAPKAPAASGKKSRLPMLLGIGAAVVLIILAIIFIPKLFGGGNDVLGRYEGVSVSMMGMTLKGEELAAAGETWIELKADDELVMMLMDEKMKGTWTLDGNEITVEADGEEVTGTLEDGVLELVIEQEGLEMTMVFEKGKGKSDKGDKEPEGPVAQQAEEVGYWTLLYMEGETEDDSLDEETVKTMKAMGMEVFLNLFADGTGEGSFFSPTEITWEDGQLRLTDLYMDCTYSIEDGQLTLEMADAEGLYVFVPGEGEAPKVEVGTGNTQTEPVDTTAAPALADYDWWEGDWYGWWIVTDATGEYAEVKDLYWDAYARIELTGENTGRIIFWDEEYSYQGPLANVEIEFEEGWGDKGAFASVKGDFDGTDVGYYDWLVDPDFGPVDEFENMIGIEGTFTDPDNNANTYDYLIILRPWGLDWSDVQDADTSDSLYDDMMPGKYESWYLPLIEKGVKELPDSFEAGQALLN